MADTPQRRADDKRINDLVLLVSSLRQDLCQFTSTYGPMLKEALDRRNWIKRMWDSAKDELVKRGIQAGVLGIIGFISWGVWVKFQSAVLSALGMVHK